MSYEAIYDAVRSRISGGNIGDVAERVIREHFDISYLKDRANGLLGGLEHDLRRPFVLMRPAMMLDGNKWCALYGENLQDGVAGFGDSPDEASYDFDKSWTTKISK